VLLASLTTYPGQGYNHSGALTGDGNTFVFMDEVPNGLPVKVLDVSDFANLNVVSTFVSNTGPTPHNPFIIGNICYIAYYQDGLQVYDLANPAIPVRIGYFDTHYQTAIGGPYPSPAYQGAWGAYPFLPSGNILVSDMQNGLFVLNGDAMFTGIDVPTAQSAIRLYPNPQSRGVSVILDIPEATSYSKSVLNVYSVEGRKMISEAFYGNRHVLQTESLSTGCYFVEINNYRCKLIIK
jgi:hypothetical protein